MSTPSQCRLPVKTIPVDFINETPVEQLAVNEEGLFRLLGLNDGRSELAMKKAAYEFRAIGEVPKLPGGVYPLAAIHRAISKRST